jgi:hypothetical protein
MHPAGGEEESERERRALHRRIIRREPPPVQRTFTRGLDWPRRRRMA